MVLAHFPSEPSPTGSFDPLQIPGRTPADRSRTVGLTAPPREWRARLGSASAGGAPACLRVRLQGDPFIRRGYQFTFTGGLRRLPPPSAAASEEKTNTPAVRVSRELFVFMPFMLSVMTAKLRLFRCGRRHVTVALGACGCPTLRKHHTNTPTLRNEWLVCRSSVHLSSP